MKIYVYLLRNSNGGFNDNLGTHSVVAGLWSSAYSLGEMLGPATGGFLLQHWGFPKASTAIAGLNLLFAITSGVYFFIRSSGSVICDSGTKEDEKGGIKDVEIKIFTIS